MSGLVFAAIAPHGGLAVEEWCSPDELHLAQATRDAFAELGRRLATARPDVMVVVTPHGVHVHEHFAVVLSAELSGVLDESEHPVALRCPGDVQLARAILSELRAESLPALGVTFGSHAPESSEMPLDWGALIPLWHLGARESPPRPAVVVSSARDRPAAEHVTVGRALARAAERSDRRVALVASADHGHAHDPDGPYGYDPTAAEYDAHVVDLIANDRLGALLDLDVPLVERAKADSFWQLLVLHGALGNGWRSDVLSYEAPTYFGMACVAYAPLAADRSSGDLQLDDAGAAGG